MPKAMQIFAGLIPLDANVTIRHLDKDGNVKPIFQEYRLTAWLIKHGFLSPRWILWGILGKALEPVLGYWATEKDGSNGITNSGRAAVAGLINGVGSVATFASIGQGTGTTAFAATQTALVTEVTAGGTGSTVHAVAAATASLVTGTVTNDTAQLVGTISETATISVTESGVFNATTAGTMVARQTFTAIGVQSGDSLQFTWQIKAS